MPGMVGGRVPLDADGEAIISSLAGDIAHLTVGDTLMIVEFHAAKITYWRIRPDSSGIPWVGDNSRTWDSLRISNVLDETALTASMRPGADTRLVLARTGARLHGNAEDMHADGAFDVARSAFPDVRSFYSVSSVDDLLAEATARVPLPASVWYELVVLRRATSGRIEVTSQQLFLPEERPGATRTFAIQCEPSDESGTAFAVAARNAAFEFQLVTMKSARIPAGTYTVTATLRRPGVVTFAGLPVKLRDDARNWLDVIAAVPERFDVVGPVHLVLAVEVCGLPDDFDARIDRARQLMEDIRRGTDGQVRFSLLSYAAHLHQRRTQDPQVNVLAWAADQQVLDRYLDWLRDRGPVDTGRARAAQIECMLEEVTRRLRAPEAALAGRPVLVTIGGRQAFPHRIDPATRIFPCPRHHDWRTLLLGLKEDHAGLALAAIRDGAAGFEDPFAEDPADEVWRHLGTDSYARAAVFDPRRLAVDVGLRGPALQYLPFPLAISEGAN
jgi:hypothetical protein